MLRKLFLPLLFILSATQLSIAQHTVPAAEFGKVSIDEFDTKPPGTDSAAAAIKLFDIGTGSFGRDAETGAIIYNFERHVRYKVINESAYDLANLEIMLYNNPEDGQEKIESVQGATYNLVNHKIITSAMGNDAVFSSRLNKNHMLEKFILPNIKEGSIIEYSYKTRSNFIFKLDDWYFQEQYPSLHSSFTIIAPAYLQYKILKGGFNPIRQSKPVEVGDVINGKAIKLEFSADSIPSVKKENFITSMEDYISKVGFELNAAIYPGYGKVDYSTTWSKLIVTLKEHVHFGHFISRDNHDQQTLRSILNGETDTLKKIDLIFNEVKNTVKWNGQYNFFTTETNQKAILTKKSGNSAEINLLLLGLLQQAGIKSYPVLISTRKNGTHPGYPLLSTFNHVIVAAESGNKRYLMDAIDKNNSIDLLSVEDLNHKGLRLDLSSKTAAWITLETGKMSQYSISYTLRMDNNGLLTGKLFISSNQYTGKARKAVCAEISNQQGLIEDYITNKPGLSISKYSTDHIDQPTEPFDEILDIAIEDNVEKAGNLLYFNPFLYERTKKNPFFIEDRKFPVDFAYPREENYNLVLDFPKSYKLEKLPESENYKLPDGSASFTIKYSSQDNEVLVSSRIRILKPVFTTAEYYSLRELYKNIVSKQSQQIVLISAKN